MAMLRFVISAAQIFILFSGLSQPLLGADSSVSVQLLMQKAYFAQRSEGDMEKAIDLYSQVIEQNTKDREYAAQACYQLGQCYENLGDDSRAQEYYRQASRDFSDIEKWSSKANEKLRELKADIAYETAARSPVFDSVPDEVKSVIAELYEKLKQEADKKDFSSNSQFYIVNDDLTLYGGGINHFINQTEKDMAKVFLGISSYNRSTYYDYTGNRLKVDFIPSVVKKNVWQVYCTPEYPLPANAMLGYCWINNNKISTTKDTNGYIALTMQNQYGIKVIESFYLIMKSELELADNSDEYSSKISVSGYTIYEYRKVLPYGSNHVAQVTIKPVGSEEEKVSKGLFDLSDEIRDHISSKVSALAGEASELDILSNSHYYYLDDEMDLWHGALSNYHNDTDKEFVGKINMGISRDRQSHYKGFDGKIMAADFVVKSNKPGYFDVFMHVDKPIPPHGDLQTIHQADTPYAVKVVSNNKIAVQMGNRFGPRALISFFLIARKDLELADASEEPAGVEYFGDYVVYDFKRETPSNEDRVVDVVLKAGNMDVNYVSTEYEPMYEDVTLKNDDGEGVGKNSSAGLAQIVKFNSGYNAVLLDEVQIYGSRYGYTQAPDEDFTVYICDSKLKVLKELKFPYSTFKRRGDTKWYSLKFEPFEVSGDFYIAVNFNAERTKGFYLYYDKESSGNSYRGKPGVSASVYDEGDWLIRAEGKRRSQLSGYEISNIKSLSLLPAPWKDGERFTMDVRLKTGVSVGTLEYTFNIASKQGRKCWLIAGEQSIDVGTGETKQTTEVYADYSSYLPVSGYTKNSLGEYKATYSKNKVMMEVNDQEPAEIVVSGDVYDNEQVLCMLRRLPLDDDFSCTFYILPVQSGIVTECRVGVVGSENVSVPAGSYDCYKLALSLWVSNIKAMEHYIWVSKDDSSSIVKYDAGSAEMLLKEVGAGQTDKKPTAAEQKASEALAAYGWRMFMEQKYDVGEQKFELACKKDPSNANAWNGLGWVQFNQGKTIAATESFTKCLAINPRTTGALNGLGYIAKNAGDMDEAVSNWQKAVEVSKDATASLSGLLDYYTEQQDYSNIIKYAELWLKAQPDNADVKQKLKDAKAKMKAAM